MKIPLAGIWRLTRFGEYVAFVVITTLLGAAAGGGKLGWPLIGVLVANWLAVGFAFMINDVEDAPDDALNPAKIRRNPVSAGSLSPALGRNLSFVVAGASGLLYALLGRGPLIAGAICLVLAYLYSWRRIRLKAIPIADLVSHGAMLAGLQFLTAYLVFGNGAVREWIFPFSLVVAISLYGQLFNELRDFDGDVAAGVRHTASFIGRRPAQWLMFGWLAIGVIAAIMTFFVIRLVPWWALILALAIAAVLFGARLAIRGRGRSSIALHQAFQKPIEGGVALALSTWFAGSSLLAVVRHFAAF